MGTASLVRRTIFNIALIACAVTCVPPAAAAFFLDLSAADGRQIGLVLKSDAPIDSVESIDIELKVDSSVLQLLDKPTFETVLRGSDFKLADCGQHFSPGNVFRSSCGGYFDPHRVPLEGGELLSWRFLVTTSLPQATVLNVNVMLGEDEPILLATTATFPIPEPGSIAWMLAGLGLVGLSRSLRRGRAGSACRRWQS